MSKTEEILSLVTQMRNEFKAHNDMLLPAIEGVISDHLKPLIDKITDIDKRLTLLEKEFEKLKCSK
jgi:hypothetical protein